MPEVDVLFEVIHRLHRLHRPVLKMEIIKTYLLTCDTVTWSQEIILVLLLNGRRVSYFTGILGVLYFKHVITQQDFGLW